MKVFGIDIIGGSVRSRTSRPRYALVRMECGEIQSEQEVSGFRLFRALASEKPEILAVDSIQEVAQDQHEIFAFLQALPPAVRLVQVTGGERKESLAKVASRYNIRFNRTDPFDEARTIARVASLGAGAEVIAFENSTDVVVSRHRSPGKGGWSQNRYVRKMHGAVQQRGREIEMALMAAGQRYEKKETHAFGGCSRVAFRVFSSRDLIPVSTYSGADIQVRISGRKLDRIMFRPVSGKPKYLIVGIDPGTTTAIAALDLEGNLEHLSSSRQTSMSTVTESLYRVGKPLVIASDVRDMPFSVEKVRRAFSAVAFSPRNDMSVEQKTEITAPYHTANDHERDALSAALEAYRYYRNKFQGIFKRIPPGYALDEVRAGLIRGLSLEQVLLDLQGRRPIREEEKHPVEASTPSDERVRVLDGMVKRLRSYVQELQGRVNEKEDEINRYQVRLRNLRSNKEARIRKDIEITTRDEIIRNLKRRLRVQERNSKKLEKRLASMKKIDEFLAGGESAPVKVLSSLTREGVRTLVDTIGILEGDLLFVKRTSGWGRVVSRELAEMKVGGIITGEDQIDPELDQVLLELRIPVISQEEIGGVLFKGVYGIVDRNLLMNALKRRETVQQAHDRTRELSRIETIFRDYRVERGKEMRRVG
ncbi:MAG: DUF460 domain-containing protein [Methanoregulaceae archaeon]|nr:DUF460 domain-containing protein [Methanoregulaceae archaeon]